MNISNNAKNIADNCRFCWMCRHLCPIGNATGHERNTARARGFAISMVVRGSTPLSEISDNIYECTLCGACTNNCVTGFDPKVFVQEVKTEVIMEGVTPPYIVKLIETYAECGNVYGADAPECLAPFYKSGSNTLFFAGQDAFYKAPEAVANALKLLGMAGVSPDFNSEQDSGAALWFLSGKTEETRGAAKRAAEMLNKYETVVVYDPVDLKLMLHEYKEWGIEISARLVSFNEYLLSLIESGAIKVNKSEREYSLQDHFAYARELDDSESGRRLIEKVGKSKDMLLVGKEANLAGMLIMNEYMPTVIEAVAKNRWTDAVNMGVCTLVTENPSEYVALKATSPEGCRVISVEEMILENI
ncbi:MAG: (Fe-S)-binding protein [Clostridia bacterium]|nr:(Fe-S)-binding protein [Clostridia bacterium]